LIKTAKEFIGKTIKNVYLIILLIYFNRIVSQLSNNESLLVFFKHNINSLKRGLFTAKFEKTINQLNDSDLLVEIHYPYVEIDYSLSANVIVWKVYVIYNKIRFGVFYAIPINKR
jgi:hypothetical protein